jgi:hypothetical protein
MRPIVAILPLFLLSQILGLAQAVRTNAGFREFALQRGDDSVFTQQAVPLGFTVNFFGVQRSAAFVTNNGNIAFTNDGDLAEFTPETFNNLRREIIAPFFADVDTRNALSDVVRHGRDTVDGRPAFAVNYVGVGYYASKADRLNSFQVVLIDRADTGAGNFDIEFNYDRIQWETGDVNGGTNGLGGTSASAGYSNGTGNPGTWFELLGSRSPGSFLDTNPNGLRYRTFNSSVPGRLVFNVRNGEVVMSTSCTTPLAVLGAPYTGQLNVGGGQGPYTWTAANIGSGLSFNSAGVISGTPNAVGTFNFQAVVRDAAQRSATASCAIQVVPCAVALSANQNVAATAGTGTFTLTAAAGCQWTATSNASWLTMVNNAVDVSSLQGAGSRTITFRFAANTEVSQRQGTITINGQSFVVTQAGSTIGQPTLNPPSAIFSANGGTGTFVVNTGSPYTATESLDWVTITAGATGGSGGTLSYTVSAYSGASQSRSGVISVNGIPFTITQNPPNSACTYSLNPTSTTIGAAGGERTLLVSTGSSCGWTAVSNVPWVTITSGANGAVSGLVAFTVAPNSGAQRTGTLTIGGIPFSIVQSEGASCPTSFVPPSATFLAGGAPGATVTVNTPCTWTATSTVPWVRITAGSSGNGPGDVTYTVDPNNSGAARSGGIVARGVLFPISQGVAACPYALSARTINVPAAGGAIPLGIVTRNGCAWSVTGTSAFAGFSPSSGNGTGSTMLSVPANPGAARSTTFTIAGQTVTIRQPALGTFSCTASGPNPLPTIRSGLMAELTGDPTFSCSGTSAGAVVADVLVTLNTNINSKKVGENVEALLLIGDPPTPTLGTNAFLGKLAGNTAVRFTGIPLAQAGVNPLRLFRITNLRADATTPDIGNDITARIDVIYPPSPVGVANGTSVVIARRAAPVNPSFGTAVQGAGQSATLPVTYQELLPNTFRTRILPGQNPGTLPINFNSESGYANSAVLGDRVGIADTGFRLQLTLRSLPAGAQVTAPTVVQSGTARADLVAQDRRGLGVGLLTGAASPLVVSNGEATATYEITAANTAALETLSFNLSFPNVNAATVNQLKGNFIASCGPIATGLPANGVLPVPRCGDPLAPVPQRQNIVLGTSFLTAAGDQRSPIPLVSTPLRRAPTGNRTVSLQVSMSCDSGSDCEEPVIRGNFSQGSSFGGSCDSSDGAGNCSGSGRDVTIEYPALEPGQQVTAVLAAELRDDSPGGSLLEFAASASTGINVSYGVIEQCFPGVSGFPQPPGEGVSGVFTVYACGPWTLTSSVPWMTFNPTSGTGNVEVQYTVQPNNTGTARNGVVTVPGATPINVQQLPPGGAGTGLRFVPVPPCRVADTRPGEGRTGNFGPPALPGGSVRTIAIWQSPCGVPSTARAYSLNITVVPNGPLAFLTVWPTGQSRPVASTLNSFDGKIVANAAILPAGSNGAVDVFVTDSTHVIIDINGYFTQ